MKNMKICALIPVYNEAPTIASVVTDTKKYVDQVLVIDDGSDDGTSAKAVSAGAECSSTGVNSGKGVAIRHGLKILDDRDLTHILFMDGDGQHKPDDIPVLISAADETDADMVIGTRKFQQNKMPQSRFFSNSLGSRITSLIVGMEILDSQCGFRLIKNDVLKHMNLRSEKYEIEMEVLIKLCRKKAKIVHAPVEMVYDDKKARSKMKPVRDTVRICFWSLFFRYLGY